MFDMRDVRAHAARRRVFARAFGKGEVRGRWEGMVKEKVERAVGRMGEEMSGAEGECDVLKWWTFVATDVSAHLMFGESFRMVELGEVSLLLFFLSLFSSLSCFSVGLVVEGALAFCFSVNPLSYPPNQADPIPQKNEYIHVLESTMLGSGIRSELPLVAAIGKLIPHPKLQAMFNANARLLDYGTRAVTSSKARGADGGSIFAQLAADEQQQQKLSDLEMRTEAGNFIVAGADTTAVSLTYLTYAVLARPALQRELEAEVARLPPAFGDADCEALPLLCAVVNETLRLYGAAPGSLPRTVPRGGVELGGYFVPEGVTVSTQAWTLHRDEGLWVDAERYVAFVILGSDGALMSGQFQSTALVRAAAEYVAVVDEVCAVWYWDADLFGLASCVDGAEACDGGVLQGVEGSAAVGEDDAGEHGCGELLFDQAEERSVLHQIVNS